jgi:hypothetical protein
MGEISCPSQQQDLSLHFNASPPVRIMDASDARLINLPDHEMKLWNSGGIGRTIRLSPQDHPNLPQNLTCRFPGPSRLSRGQPLLKFPPPCRMQ